jgi:thiamine transport system substrate-binding protein
MRRWFCILALLLAGCGGQSAGSPTPAPPQPATAAAPTAAPAGTGAPAETPAPGAQATLTVMTHDSFTLSKEVLAEFEQQHGAKIALLPSGDAGAALNKAILAKDAPLADVFFGVDNTFLGRALASGIFEPYKPPALASLPQQFQLDPSGQLTPIDYGFVTINYDKAYLDQHGLTPPQSLRDLTKPEWKSLLIVENPATSSPGLAFMLATIATFGSEGTYTWLDYWREMRANDVLVAEGWNDAYYTNFSGSSGQGPRPLVVSYTTSPAAEVYFSEGKLQQPPTANMAAGSFLQVEFAGILKGSKQRALAEQFIEFLLSKRVQEDIPLQMFVYPVAQDAALPQVFTDFAPPPSAYVSVEPAQIDQNRDQWLAAWTKTVLR